MKKASSVLTILASAAVALGAASAMAEEEYTHEKTEDYQSLIEEFSYTGESKICLKNYDIEDSDVIDDYNILFETRGGDYYLNTLEHRCPGLKIEDRFTYTLRGIDRLCDTDTITVLYTVGISGATCQLGEFHELSPREGQTSQ